MGKNQIGGKKHKRGQNNNNARKAVIYADGKDTIYGMIMRSLGDCRFSVSCNDGQERIGVVRGALYKSTFINVDDIVLVGLRNFQTDTSVCDIIYKYNQQDVADLRKDGQLVGKLANRGKNESGEKENFDFGGGDNGSESEEERPPGSGTNTGAAANSTDSEDEEELDIDMI